ncbi:MAG: hypothetical protein ACK4GU_01900 [Alishewanella aestuarii]
MQELTFEQVEDVSGGFHPLNDGRVGLPPLPRPDWYELLIWLQEQQQ